MRRIASFKRMQERKFKLKYFCPCSIFLTGFIQRHIFFLYLLAQENCGVNISNEKP